MDGTNYQYSSAEDDSGYSCDSCGTTWSAALYGKRCPNGCEDTDDTCVSPLPPFLDEETHYLIPPYYGRACRTGEPLVTKRLKASYKLNEVTCVKCQQVKPPWKVS